MATGLHDQIATTGAAQIDDGQRKHETHAATRRKYVLTERNLYKNLLKKKNKKITPTP